MTVVATPIVDAKLAYDCLNSVPLGKESALEYVKGIPAYLDWQSDLVYKKDPPADYPYPPVDVRAEVAKVQADLEADKFANEYAFQAALYQPFAKSHDGHFVVYSDLLTKAIEFSRYVPLVSISSTADGESPKIYFKSDLNSSCASPVKNIEGVHASKFVEEWAYTATYNQDADAAYNSMFYEKANAAAGNSQGGYFSVGGRMRYIYPGPTTKYEFENGTKVEINNVGHVKGNFSNVTDGPSFYKKFCTPAVSEASAAATGASLAVTAEGYPPAVVITNDTTVSCYFLDGEGFEDVAVLSMLSFEPESPVEFQQVVQQCIADSKAAGKTKMVIDVQANGGGYILQGYDTFRQFFPDIVQDGYSRFPESDAFLTAAHITSDLIPADYDPNTASPEIIQNYENFLNYRYDYNLTNDNFTTFDTKFAPQVFQGQPYSALVRWNFNDPLTTINETYGIGFDVTGYRSRRNFTQPFAAENLILLYDGVCASTCTIFSEGMRIQGNVSSVMFGGRPNKKKIQGVGGIKGSQAISFQYVYDQAQDSKKHATTAAQNESLSVFTEAPLLRSASTGLNLRDQILRGNVNDGIPAQYVVEEADCRLFWTKDMINDVSAIWKAAAKAAWGGGKCVAGSLADKTAKRGIQEPARRVVTKPWNGVTKRMAIEKREVAKSSEAWNEVYNVKAIP